MAKTSITVSDSSVSIAEVSTGQRKFGVLVFSIFWVLAYAVLLVWGYFSSIHWRTEFPTLAGNELHPLRIALNETVSLLPLLALGPWFGAHLGANVTAGFKHFWGRVLLFTFFAAAAQGIWVILVDLAHRVLSGHATGNEASYGIMVVTFFVTTFLVVGLVHCLLAAIIRHHWNRQAA